MYKYDSGAALVGKSKTTLVTKYDRWHQYLNKLWSEKDHLTVSHGVCVCVCLSVCL